MAFTRTNWNDVIRHINGIIASNGLPAALLPEAPSKHRWSQSDVLVARNKLSEISLVPLSFVAPLIKWNQDIIDELMQPITSTGYIQVPRLYRAGCQVNTVRNSDDYVLGSTGYAFEGAAATVISSLDSLAAVADAWSEVNQQWGLLRQEVILNSWEYRLAPVSAIAPSGLVGRVAYYLDSTGYARVLTLNSSSVPTAYHSHTSSGWKYFGDITRDGHLPPPALSTYYGAAKNKPANWHVYHQGDGSSFDQSSAQAIEVRSPGPIMASYVSRPSLDGLSGWFVGGGGNNSNRLPAYYAAAQAVRGQEPGIVLARRGSGDYAAYSQSVSPNPTGHQLRAWYSSAADLEHDLAAFNAASTWIATVTETHAGGDPLFGADVMGYYPTVIVLHFEAKPPA
jgi:hypothetical protein